LLIGLAAMLVAAIAGAIYQSVTVRRALARHPPPGQLVDLGNRRLHLLCIGAGSPTVIFESSAFGSSLSSSVARTEVSAITRACSYDRMGMAWSDPGPAVITAADLTADLERLIERAPLTPPFILVPASIGGVTAEMFARRHPDLVAGAVFVDAASSGSLALMLPYVTRLNTAAVCLAPTAARIGWLRLIDPMGLRKSPADADRAEALLYRPEPMATICGMVRGAAVSAGQLRAAPPWNRSLPLTVLSAESGAGLMPARLGELAASPDALARERTRLHQELAAQSTRGTWRVVPGSDHLIGNSRPHDVAAAVIEMVNQWRAELRPPR
jgi:pimeloyl-ACP methyl ester carboxylesterase